MSNNKNLAIIDPHIHLWDPYTTPRITSSLIKLFGWNPRLYRAICKLLIPKAAQAFLGDAQYLIYPYLPNDYQKDISTHKVQSIVHVQAGWEKKSGIGAAGETKWLEQIFSSETASNNFKLDAIIGQAHLEKVTALSTLIENHQKSSHRFVGIRDMLAWSDDPGVMKWGKCAELSNTKEWRQGFEMLAEHNLSFDAWIYHTQLTELNKLACTYPSQQIILDHMATPIGLMGPFAGFGHTKKDRDLILKQWQEGIALLAENKNVAVKLSGMFMPIVGWNLHQVSSQPSTTEIVDKLQPLIEFTLEQFGVDRCIFASNFPMDKVSLSYQQLYDIYKEMVQGRSMEEQEMLFAKNAQRIYKIA